MLLYAKSALSKEQLDGKVAIGYDGIEIQLLSELIDGSIGNYKLAEEAFDLKSLADYDVKAVHAPVLSYEGVPDLTLENFGDDIFLLEQVFKIAEFYGNHHNSIIDIIVHSESKVSIMKRIGNTWDKVTTQVGYLLFKYPHTRLLIENVTPIRGTMNDLVLTNNFLFDNVVMAERLREALNTDRVGTVLDVCHAKISSKYIRMISKELGIAHEDMSLENYLVRNLPTLGLVHFADMRGSGHGKGQHGTVPTDELNREFVELYRKYECSCPVTLEVDETDYIKSSNYAEAYRNIRKLLDEN